MFVRPDGERGRDLRAGHSVPEMDRSAPTASSRSPANWARWQLEAMIDHVETSQQENYPGLTVSRDGDAIVVRIPVRFHRRNGRQMVLTHGGSNGHAAPERGSNGSLVSALAKAYRWQEQLESGGLASLEDLAAANGVDLTYVGRILRLISLAPEIVEQILDGYEPAGVIKDDCRGPLLNMKEPSGRNKVGIRSCRCYRSHGAATGRYSVGRSRPRGPTRQNGCTACRPRSRTRFRQYTERAWTRRHRCRSECSRLRSAPMFPSGHHVGGSLWPDCWRPAAEPRRSARPVPRTAAYGHVARLPQPAGRLPRD